MQQVFKKSRARGLGQSGQMVSCSILSEGRGRSHTVRDLLPFRCGGPEPELPGVFLARVIGYPDHICRKAGGVCGRVCNSGKAGRSVCRLKMQP